MKKIIFYLIILKKAFYIAIYGFFMQKNRLSIRIRKNIENYLFFQPSKFRAVPLDRNLLGKFRPVRFLTTDRVKLYAWFIEPEPNKVTILYLHGQAESILKHQNVAKFCIDNGFGLFLLSYRGHYKSSGWASEKGVYTDAQSGTKWLAENGISPESIVIWGHSMGTVTTIETAINNNVKGIILQSPIKDIKSAAIDVNNFYCNRMHMPALTALNREILQKTDFIQKFDGLSKIKKVKCPILILHSKTDRIAPYTNSIALAQNNPNAILKILDRGTHWDCAWCIQSIFEFIEYLEYINKENTEKIEVKN